MVLHNNGKKESRFWREKCWYLSTFNLYYYYYYLKHLFEEFLQGRKYVKILCVNLSFFPYTTFSHINRRNVLWYHVFYAKSKIHLYFRGDFGICCNSLFFIFYTKYIIIMFIVMIIIIMTIEMLLGNVAKIRMFIDWWQFTELLKWNGMSRVARMQSGNDGNAEWEWNAGYLSMWVVWGGMSWKSGMKCAITYEWRMKWNQLVEWFWSANNLICMCVWCVVSVLPSRWCCVGLVLLMACCYLTLLFN